MIDNHTLEEMTYAPTEHFDAPVAVIEDDRLSHAQKAAVLQAWADACRRDQADTRGNLPSSLDRSYLKEVEQALERLAELRRS